MVWLEASMAKSLTPIYMICWLISASVTEASINLRDGYFSGQNINLDADSLFLWWENG